MPRIGWPLCTAIVPLIGIAALTAVLAQQTQAAGIVIIDLFTDDSADPNPEEAQRLVDAVRTSQAPSDGTMSPPATSETNGVQPI
jgi:hypothetical protein